MLLYESTRGHAKKVPAAEAIVQGLAPDGGLFVPQANIQLGLDQLVKIMDLPYAEQAQSILQLYLPDFTPDELKACVTQAYSPEKFSHPDIAPVVPLNPKLYCLELWHGPTCAFKDMALQILPHLLTLSAQKCGKTEEILILVATSGDTGKAALEGFRDVPGTKILVFYPEQGVSAVQKQQMVTQEGNNVAVVAVRGNFDHAQQGVKKIFSDPSFNADLAAQNLALSSANSINWGRLVPQIIYYLSAYGQLVKQKALTYGAPINLVVPTGNFGNILAGFYARQLGLPIQRLICAANTNHVLTDFIRTGVYNRNRPFTQTISPSMDILVSSNLERLLYELTNRDAARIRTWMQALNTTGTYSIDSELLRQVQNIFWSDCATDAETRETIRETYEKNHYILDTHTAVAKKVYTKYQNSTGDQTLTLIASTANPLKFSASVGEAIFSAQALENQNEFALMERLAQAGSLTIPAGLQNLKQKPIRHKQVTDPAAMSEAILDFI